MGGSVPFEEALAARLSLFNPSLSQVQDFLEKRPPRYVGFLHYFEHVLTCLLNMGGLDSLVKNWICALTLEDNHRNIAILPIEIYDLYCLTSENIYWKWMLILKDRMLQASPKPQFAGTKSYKTWSTVQFLWDSKAFSALIGASFSGVEYVSLSSLLIMLPDCIGCCFLLFLLQLNFSFSIPGSNFKNHPLCYRFLHG